MTSPRTYAPDDASVVVVIGSGAGGGTLSRALAERGIDVVCLEAGGRLTMADIVNDEAQMFGKFTWLDERIGVGDIPAGFPTWNCKTVGGTTLHWTAACPRLQAHEMKALSTYGKLPGTSISDWPFSLSELVPWYERAEHLMGVTGTHGIERLPANNNFQVMEAGGRRVGYRDMDTNNVAINSAPRDGRPSCLQLGFCTSGCATGAKWSTLYTEVPKAEQTGRFELRTQCMAIGLQSGKDGRVTAVRYLDAQGETREQKLRAICVAGNVVETTRLLLNSATEQSPQGLANSSGQLGRNYMRHLLAGVVAVMPGEVNMHKGAQCAGVIKDETRHDPARGFAGGFQLHTVMFTPETLANLLMPGAWGRKLSGVIERYRKLAALLIVGEDPAMPDNRVTLHPTRKDRYGLPVPVMTYRHHDNSRKLVRYAVGAAKKVYSALGAEEIYEMVDVFPSTHNMGTARMGDDPARNVCNRWGRTHDIANLYIADGSLFPSAGCENPTLTIVALALRQADYLAAQLESVQA
ncbi:MAG: GMC family oxidoreductase [Gammaproteobacteria bacterium]|nr:GMC family oxidoreductase [Gammaproteobacteria bacterium]